MGNVSELIERVADLIDDEIENKQAVDWFNQCQNEAVSSELYLPKRVTLVANDQGHYKLPDDYKDDLKILDMTLPYMVVGDTIYVDGGTPNLDITYDSFPRDIPNDPTFVPDIPTKFHSLYIFYAASMYMLMDEELERYQTYNYEFEKAKEGLLASAENMRKLSVKRNNIKAWKVVR